MDEEFDEELEGNPQHSAFATVYEGEPPTRLVLSSKHFGVLVDIAPLVIGHLLVVPRRKVLAFAKLNSEEWADWLAIRAVLIPELEAIYGVHPVLMEHGSDASLEVNACILHAHMHVLPLPAGVVLDFAADGYATRQIAPQSLTQVGLGDAGYFYGERSGEQATVAEIVPGTRPASQYLRRLVAQQLGTPDRYDWGVFIERDRLRRTLTDLRHLRDLE